VGRDAGDVPVSPIDAYATFPHYAAHLLPVLAALPDDRRGNLYISRPLREALPGALVSMPPQSRAPLLVAGYQDRPTRRPHVLVSHGAGQTYLGCESPSYDGGPGREHIGLFLCPREESAARNRARYPGAVCVPVGAPILDTWARIPAPQNDRLTVAVSFHWQCRMHRTLPDGAREMIPEAGWAFPSWRETIGRLAREPSIDVIGHGHPRAREKLRGYWADLRVEAVWSPEEILRRADVLVIDNSSFAYEWAAVGRPVVLLNDADWRPDVEHGLRFWDRVPGPQVWPEGGLFDLLDAIDAACRRWTDGRRRVTEQVYGPTDGRASVRAAEAILAWEADGCPHRIDYAEGTPCGC